MKAKLSNETLNAIAEAAKVLGPKGREYYTLFNRHLKDIAATMGYEKPEYGKDDLIELMDLMDEGHTFIVTAFETDKDAAHILKRAALSRTVDWQMTELAEQKAELEGRQTK